MNLRALFRQLPATAYLYALLAAALLSLYAGWAHYQREIGRRDILTALARAELRDAKRQIDSLGKVYRVDTLRLTRYRLKTDSLTTTVELWKHDTVRVVEYVARANSTIRVCTQALATCDAMVGAERRGRIAAETDARLLRRAMPGRLTPWRHRAEGAVVAGVIIWLSGRAR